MSNRGFGFGSRGFCLGFSSRSFGLSFTAAIFGQGDRVSFCLRTVFGYGNQSKLFVTYRDHGYGCIYLVRDLQKAAVKGIACDLVTGILIEGNTFCSVSNTL